MPLPRGLKATDAAREWRSCWWWRPPGSAVRRCWYRTRSPIPLRAGVTGRFYDRTREAGAAAQAYDPGARAELWRRSLELTGHPDIG